MSTGFLPSALRFQDVPEEDLPRYSPIPPRSLNGGLYTGEPFLKNAPWRNFPYVPSADAIMQEQLKSANPPPGAQVLYPSGNTRPGNNRIEKKGIVIYDEKTYGDMMCSPGKDKKDTTTARQNLLYSPISGRPQKFAAYAYL